MKLKVNILAVLLLNILLSVFTVPRISAQDSGPADTEAVSPPEISADNEESAGGTPDLAASVLEMDIKTSTLMELAAMCRSLGLSDGGGKEELARRLRAHYKLSEAGAKGEGADQKIITIESARSTEYFSLEAVDEEYARLRGDVIVSLKDGGAVHRIKAWEILYNRTRNIMTASGGVEYIKEEGSTIETFKGDSITVNLDNWSSIFLDGVSERSLQDDETTYRFAGTIISKNEEDVTVLTRAEISNARNEEAYWKLNASKLWLLPGADFAIFNAILKVGEIPMLYIPFFYFPADEVIFHPVLGYRSREGSFIQTTTYILGRPKAESASESSISSIMGNNNDMEKRRDGIFLRSTGKKKQNTEEISLKALLDFYTNLGIYAGTDMQIPKKGILNSADFSGGLAFSRTIFREDNPGVSPLYSPFAPSYNGDLDWNKSRFISLDVPFRYRLNTTGSLSGRYGSFSWAFPYYSDPYVDRDFLDRSEQIDWVHIIQEGASIAEEESSDTEIGSYEWRLNSSLTPSLPALAPYLSTLSLSSFTSTIGFRTRDLPITDPSYNDFIPSRKFFIPDKFSIFSFSGSIAGTPLTINSSGVNRSSPAGRSEGQTEDKEAVRDSLLPASPRPPWEIGEEADRKNQVNAGELSPPALSQRFDLPGGGGPRFKIDYQLTPSAASELQFRSTELGAKTRWKRAEDINWSEVSSLLTSARGDTSTSFTFDHENGAFTNTFTFSGTGYWQGYSFINEESEEYTDSAGLPDRTAIEAARERTYRQTYFTTSWAYSTQVRPFFQSAVWGNTSLDYSVKGLLAKTDYKGMGANPAKYINNGHVISGGIGAAAEDDPLWEVLYGSWDKENLDLHQFSANFAASVMDKAQTFVLTADLPPEEPTLTGNATFRVWITETNAHMKIFDPGSDEKRTLDPFYATETIKFGTWGSIQQYLVLDPKIGKDNQITTLTTTLSFPPLGLTTSYTAIRAIPYKLNYRGSEDPSLADGWIQIGDEQLVPRDFTFGFAKTFKKDGLWKNRFSFSINVNSNLSLDLQRYTYSRFTFSLGFTLGITNFLDINLSANSENAVIYRYFKDVPFFALPYDLPEGDQNNVFLDLVNSFRFDSDARRTSSGFKMKSFNLSLVHHLGDWNATLGVTLSPLLDQTSFPYHYKFNNEISFVVQWIPMSEIKTDISYIKDAWIFK
jgi:hypothetical protein